MAKLSAEQWSVYWQKGTITTFLGRFGNNYDGEIRAFWQQVLSDLPDPAQIVDLATGNGALAILASETSIEQQRDLKISAIDYAQIDPTGEVLKKAKPEVLKRIEFHADTSMESTGLAAHEYDAAFSQFGFEYGSPLQTVAELDRILKPSATVALMMHREGSVLCQQANDGLQQVTACHNSGLHAELIKLLKLTDALQRKGKDPGEDTAAEILRDEINEITGSLHDEIEEHTDPTQLGFFLQNSMAVFSPQFAQSSLDDKLAMLDTVNSETVAYEQRMNDLITAARTDDNIRQLEVLLNKTGFTIKRSEVFIFEGHDFCHSLIASRNTTPDA